MFPHAVTVTVKRPGGRDREGDALPGTTHTIGGCAVYPRTSTEQDPTGAAVTVITGRWLIVPFGSDVTSDDRIVLGDGTEWSVEGDPAPWQSPFTGWQPGTQVGLQRAKGA